MLLIGDLHHSIFPTLDHDHPVVVLLDDLVILWGLSLGHDQGAGLFQGDIDLAVLISHQVPTVRADTGVGVLNVELSTGQHDVSRPF